MKLAEIHKSKVEKSDLPEIQQSLSILKSNVEEQDHSLESRLTNYLQNGKIEKKGNAIPIKQRITNWAKQESVDIEKVTYTDAQSLARGKLRIQEAKIISRGEGGKYEDYMFFVLNENGNVVYSYYGIFDARVIYLKEQKEKGMLLIGNNILNTQGDVITTVTDKELDDFYWNTSWNIGRLLNNSYIMYPNDYPNSKKAGSVEAVHSLY